MKVKLIVLLAVMALPFQTSVRLSAAGALAARQRSQERWIWTELIAFDSEQADLGVEHYLKLTGFAPEAICLLLGSPDFVLTHPGMEKEVALPAEYCSRDGHEFNRERTRQAWTNFQLRSLIDELHQHGVAVYVSIFAKYYRDKTHHEWISDHREVLQVWKDNGMIWSLNCLARLRDGSYFEAGSSRLQSLPGRISRSSTSTEHPDDSPTSSRGVVSRGRCKEKGESAAQHIVHA